MRYLLALLIAIGGFMGVAGQASAHGFARGPVVVGVPVGVAYAAPVPVGVPVLRPVALPVLATFGPPNPVAAQQAFLFNVTLAASAGDPVALAYLSNPARVTCYPLC